MEHAIISTTPSEYLRSKGTVFAVFDRRESGNVSYGVQIEDKRYYAKTAGSPDDQDPVLSHSERVARLRNAVLLSRSCDHPALPRLLQVIESASGPMLIYEWLEGELLGVERDERENPASAFQRFRHLPAATICGHLDTIFNLHVKLAGAGWTAVDFYDGSLIYDFQTGHLGVVDLDEYRRGPFRNEMGRMFGSSRFMAPEEFELNALIDEVTNVFVMGRTALVFLSDGTLNQESFRGSVALFSVIQRACQPERAHRYESLESFHEAWRAAR
jgi:serine/threonine-protein kinase